jgi:nitrate reductase alpha subunit
MPEYEPRGCPRGALFSWYTYSPSRVRFPYVRGPLLEMWRETRAWLGDPVQAWAEITGDQDSQQDEHRSGLLRRFGPHRAASRAAGVASMVAVAAPGRVQVGR